MFITTRLRPFQRLDVRVPAVLWTPALPAALRPAGAKPAEAEEEELLKPSGAAADKTAASDLASDDYKTHRARFCGLPVGWLVVGHLFVGDALNNSAFI